MPRPSFQLRSSRPSPSRSSRRTKSAAARRRLQVVGALEHRAGVGERRDHQRVPGGEALVVEPRPYALGAHVVEAAPPLVAALGLAGPAHRDVAALEVAAVGGAEPGDRLVGVRQVAQRGAHLLDRPDVELALHALGVRVERRVEAALGAAHLAQGPIERLLGDGPEQRLAGHLPAVQVGAREQRVVVEHLLEVGDQPVRVHRVAREAAAHLVVHPAGGHRAQRVRAHLGLAAAQQELDRRGRRELRRLAEAAVGAVVACHAATRPPASSRLSSNGCSEGASSAPPRRRWAICSPPARISSRRSSQALATASSTERQLGMPMRELGREVRAGEERHLLGREEHVQRPAALARHRLAGLHVDRVEVRPLLAVELDGHEALVHQRRRVRVLERLALHHVAPVAGRVADREQDRPLLLACARKRLLAPGVPIHRVVLVLEQVRRGLVGKPVGHRRGGYSAGS